MVGVVALVVCLFKGHEGCRGLAWITEIVEFLFVLLLWAIALMIFSSPMASQ